MSETATSPSLQDVHHAWVEPNGRFHPVEHWGHDKWSEVKFGVDGSVLIEKGWIRLTEGEWDTTKVTQCQLDTIFDWHVSNWLLREFRPQAFKVI